MTTYFAHRGLSSLAPENTLAAFRLAAEHGFTWFETDVDLSKDGVPVVLHDTDLDRTTDLSGSIYDYTAEALEEADAGSWFGAEFAGGEATHPGRARRSHERTEAQRQY